MRCSPALLIALLACGPSTIEEASTFQQLDALVREGALAGRDTLELRDKGWGPELARMVEAAPDTGALRTLDLRGNLLGVAGAVSLAEADSLRGLHTLRLGPGRIFPDGQRLGDAGVRALAASPRLDGLEVLDVARNGVGPKGAAALSRGPVAEGLKALYIESNPLGDAGATALVGGTLGPLEILHAGWCEIGPEGATALANAPGLRGLHELLLSSNPIGNTGGVALAGADLPDLEKLYLSHTSLDDSAAAAFAAAGGLGALTHLNLDGNGLTDDGAKALAASPGLQRIEWLSLRDNLIGEDGRAALKERFGDRVEL
ncbi:MAG: hypothetical protein H6739_41470 [Alphaproteobacteria bacterium]|nr:hypothetical protein [Alphaproteobacteria bacterium]